jgi:cytochrome c556
MKIRVLLLSLICALVTVPGLRAAAAGPKDKDDDEQTELGDHMEKLSGAYKRLGREVADPAKNEDSLKQIAIIREQAEAALKLQPAKTADLPADQREKFVAGFHDKMKSFIDDVNKVEAALKAGKNEEAKQLLGTLKQDQREGHKEYQKKKDKM